MVGSFDGRMPTRGVEQAIVALKKGAHLLKCGKRGKPKLCPFRLSSVSDYADEKTLVWYSKNREKHLSLNFVSTVVIGHKTINFLRQHWPEKEIQSLSLVYKNGKRSLDLICRDRDQAECWYLGLTALISAPCSSFSLVGSESNIQINNCTNSPQGYIQRKSRLSSVLDTPRHTQVYPSYVSPKVTPKKNFSDNLDCSEALFHPRQRTLSDIDSYLEKLTHKVATPVKHGMKDIMVAKRIKEQNTQTPKLKLFEGPRAACRLDSLKDVFLWGDVLGSMLGGEDLPKALPRLVDSTKMLDVQSIACGENHVAIVTKQGEVFSWGKESSEKLGHKGNFSLSCPKIVGSLGSIHVKAVAFGSKHTCAVTVSGELFEWGEGANSLSLLNDWYGRNQWFPHKLFGPMNNISVSKIACGEWHTAIITSSGQLFTYGEGTFGVLGHGDTHGIARPKEVDSLKGLKATSVACGPWHTAAIVEVMSSLKVSTPSSKLYTWGDADRWKLGHADKKMKLVPTCVDSLIDYDFVQVSCGMALTVVLTVTGVVFTLGSSRHGQLGDPQADGESICTVEGLLKTEFVREISSGSSHVAVLTTNGKVFTWGKGVEGQLGLGDYVDRSSPTLVEALEGRHVESISCGSNFTAAICMHKSISTKDHSVCSGCQMALTRKKHNCYNCGSMFCNSCSSNKIAKASLAPDLNKRYHVCGACFCQLQKVVDSSTIKSKLKLKRGEMFKNGLKAYTPKLSRIFKEASFIVEKMALVHGPNQRNEDFATTVQVKTQRWGHVKCPTQFISAQDSFQTKPMSKSQICGISCSKRMHDSVVLSADGQREELKMMDTILTEEVKQLRSQVTVLAEQCEQKSFLLLLYKQKLDETWLVVRDEAAKCKAAKDIIKVLTDQRNALSEKLLVGQLSRNSKVTPNSNLGQTIKAELQDYPNKKPVTCKFSQLSYTQILDINSQGGKKYTPSSNTVVPADESFSHQNGGRTFGGDDYITEADSAVAPIDGVIEQIERGVYATLAVSPDGKKGMRRIRFSRKHFGKKEAQSWWEENKSRVYAKYNIEQLTTPLLNL